VKLGGAEAARFLARPDPATGGALLYGPDPMRTALKRQALVAALIGPEGPAEMRLTRIAAAELRRDPAALLDALKAAGFFPGPRVVLVEDAGDAQAAPIAAALADWRPGDAALVATAGELRASSPLRKAFEAARHAAAIAIYADPPGRAEIEAALARAGLGDLRPAAMADVEALARALDPGDFAQFVEKLGLYKLGDAAPVTPEDVAAVAPPAAGAEADALLDLAAERRPDALAEAMLRFGGGASGATGLVIAAGRRFRTLYAAALAPDGPEAALGRARPPVFGPRRARLAAQARALGPERLERALALILDADLALRSSRPPPARALAERLLVRIAMLREP
jgi:DNA polymerase-3 subunit delta